MYECMYECMYEYTTIPHPYGNNFYELGFKYS